MQDQCDQLRSRGIRAEAWVGGNGDRVLDNVRFGNTQFLYMAPERIRHPLFLARQDTGMSGQWWGRGALHFPMGT